MRANFDAAADAALGGLRPGEDITLWWAEEHTDFCRFNAGQVRQAGHVRQLELTLRLIVGRRHAALTVSVGDDAPATARATLASLRGWIAHLPDDPHLMWEQTGGLRGETVALGDLIDGPDAAAAICRAAAGTDLVGILASGPIARGFASSRGARAFHAATSWHLDYSLHLSGDKAVKASIAGRDWNEAALQASIEDARSRLALLTLPVVEVPRGTYRAWLEPAAVNEILALLAWNGFSERERRTRQSALLRLAEGEERLSSMLSLAEVPGDGLAPRFSSDGFERPLRVPLIDAGVSAGSLIAPRTAAEYGLDTDGCDDDESPAALVMAPGMLDARQSVELVGDGVWIGNLWYLNWSDRAMARMTGMTRFASFAVRDGKIAGPLAVMRFDDSVYRMLGDGLLGLGDVAAWMPDAGSYGRRSTSSVAAPGALIDAFRFAL